MASPAIVAAALTTPDTSRTLSVFVGGLDVTGDVLWSSFTVTDSGTNAKGTASFTITKALNLMPEITDQAMVRVEDVTNAAAPEVFRGFVRARTPEKDPKYPSVKIIADDISSLLDDAIIPVELRETPTNTVEQTARGTGIQIRRPESMQARIGYLWGKYAGSYLSGDLSSVAAVGSTLPLQRFEAVTLRQAIEMVIAQASSTADYYVDMLGKLHVFVTETNDAPFDIDADAPGAGEIAPQSLDIDFDSKSYANRVFVKGATPDASLFVQDEAAIAAANGLVRTAMIQAPDCTTSTMATSLGQMYLGRVKTGKPRGVFVTHTPNDGWRGGQNVLVTSADHGLSAQSYRIARVTTKVLKPGSDFKRSYRVEFGGAQAGSGLDGQMPLIAGSSAGVYMLDQLGDSLVSAAASAALGGVGPVVRRYITSGIYNGDFAAPPPGPDAPIDDDTNPLPYWDELQASGTVLSYRVAANTGSGYRIRMIINSGSGSASGRLAQIVPINASDSNAFFHNPKAFVTNTGGTTSANIQVRVETWYLKNDATTITGTSGTTVISLATLGASGTTTVSAVPNSGRVPSDAYYLRVNFQFERTSIGGSDTGEVEWSEVWLETGQGQLPQGCIAARTTTQSITNGAYAAIQFNATDISDPFGFHDPVTNNTRFTIPTGWDGTYLLVGQSGFAALTGTRLLIGWGLNGSAPADPHQHTYNVIDGTGMAMNISTVMELAAGDYVELQVFQDSAGAVNTQGTERGSVFYIGEVA